MALQQKPVHVLTEKSMVATIDEAVIDEREIRMTGEKVAAKVALPHSRGMSAICDLSRLAIVVLGDGNVPSAGVRQGVIGATEFIRVDVDQNAGCEGEIDGFAPVVEQRSQVSINSVDSRKRLERLGIDLNRIELGDRKQCANRAHVEADVSSQLEYGFDISPRQDAREKLYGGRDESISLIPPCVLGTKFASPESFLFGFVHGPSCLKDSR